MNLTLFQRLRLAAAVSAAVLVMLPGVAQAHENPETELPFETRFPQEMEVTSFFSSYGDPRPGGRRHQGNDLMAPKMTEVYAFAAGVVRVISEAQRPGRFVIIEHEGGWETYYIHLNNDTPGTDDGHADWSLTVAPGIEEGTRVKAGQLIGWVGDSGNAEDSGAQIHFELRHDEKAVDPYPYLMAAWEAELNRLNLIPLGTQIF